MERNILSKWNSWFSGLARKMCALGYKLTFVTGRSNRNIFGYTEVVERAFSSSVWKITPDCFKFYPCDFNITINN